MRSQPLDDGFFCLCDVSDENCLEKASWLDNFLSFESIWNSTCYSLGYSLRSWRQQPYCSTFSCYSPQSRTFSVLGKSINSYNCVSSHVFALNTIFLILCLVTWYLNHRPQVLALNNKFLISCLVSWCLMHVYKCWDRLFFVFRLSLTWISVSSFGHCQVLTCTKDLFVGLLTDLDKQFGIGIPKTL